MNINHYITLLDQNTINTITVAKACSELQLNTKPDGKWSPLGVLEHICITDKLIYSMLSRPASSVSEQNEIIGNEKLKRLMVGLKDRKVMAPEMLHPKGDIKDPTAFEKVFTEQREQLKQDLESGKIIIDNRIYKHPMMGEMTVSDWLNFMIHHTQRHVIQIGERALV
ncbi:MAG TPA: DinB family protein [Bacteroidia bacterium]